VGAPLWCTGELAETLSKVQPFRYRGYVFDEETGLYYLRSRYYNPELGRFYGSDRIYKGNLFAYCCNQVLNTVDRNGKDAIWITDETGISHSSVLIQDAEGDWYYYYWGAAGNNGSSGSSKMGSNASSGGMGNVCVIYEKN
jgi:RHS repeat-associated protein